MLAFIRNLFSKKPQRFPTQNIFAFHDGVRARLGDPIAILRALDNDPEFNQRVHTVLIDEGDLDAIRIGAAAIRRAMSVPSFEEGGLTEQGCLNLMIQYYNYVSSLKKNISVTRTSPPLTAYPFSERSTTKPSADSSSTATDQNADKVPA